LFAGEGAVVSWREKKRGGRADVLAERVGHAPQVTRASRSPGYGLSGNCAALPMGERPSFPPACARRARSFSAAMATQVARALD